MQEPNLRCYPGINTLYGVSTLESYNVFMTNLYVDLRTEKTLR